MEFNIIFYLSISFFIVSNVLLLTQGIINFKFFKFNDRKIITERTLFEQFSYEVYSSINSPLLLEEIRNKDLDNNKCPSSCEAMEINLNLNTYFDCRGVFIKDLYSSCQDSIIKNYTSCNENPDINNNYNSYDYLNDNRAKYCTYFSKYSSKKAMIKDKCFCGKKFDSLKYEQLLSNSVPNYDDEGNMNSCQGGYYKCGILDTMENILCLKNYPCPAHSITNSLTSSISDPNKKVMASFIISENHPLNHEWDVIIRERNEKLSNKESDKRRYVSKADFKLFDEEIDNTYEKIVENIPLGDIFSDYSQYKYNNNQNLNIYARNFIGFKNVKELNKFKKHFNEDDYRDNPLYKLSSSGHNPIITIVFSSVFLSLSIAFLIVYIKIGKIKSDDIKRIMIYIFVGITSLFIIAALIIIGVHFEKYPRIYIDMDERMKKVLDAYNKRTFFSQLYRIISVCLNLISFVLAIIYIILNHFFRNREAPAQAQAQEVPA